MFKNKHIIVAMMVAPLLAIAAYFATDMLVGEKPHKVEPGSNYQLLGQPNCRYESGKCVMGNGNFKVTITGKYTPDGLLLMNLQSNFPLDHASMIVVSDPTDTTAPVAMTLQKEPTQWGIQFNIIKSPEQQLRIVLGAQGAVYFGETITPFIDYVPSFNKDFRKP